MIAWKAKVAYIPNTEEITNISSVKFDDENSAFPFITELEDGILTPSIEGFSSNLDVSKIIRFNENFQQVYDFADLLLKSDSTKLYGCTASSISSDYSSRDEYLTYMKQLFPGYYSLYPNSISKYEQDYISSGSSNSRFGFYIPSLSRFLIVGGTRTNASIFKVNGDGSLTNLVSNPGIYSNTFTGFYHGQKVGETLRGIKYDGTKESILDPKNYFLLITYSYSKGVTGFGVDIIDPSNTNKLNSFKSSWIDPLFGDYVPPDYDASAPPNPYEPGGPSGEGGGNGSFDDESDIITIPSLPTISSSDTGFTRIYNPTLAQVQELARYLWTEESVIETIWNHIKQYFENPMEAIIGFNLVPVPVPNGGTTTFKLMYIDTGVAMTAAANQFVDVDCGTLELKEYYGSALDYSPFTKISCFLPYIGNVSLNVDEVMARTLGVKYRVDICSGACVAYITVDGNAIYQYSGHCAIPIPISAADFSNYVTATISTAKLAAAGITAGVGVAAGMMTEDPSPQTNQIVKVTKQVQTARNPATGRQITTGTTTTTVEKPTEQDNTNASFAGLAPQNIANTVGTIMGSKPHIEHSGSFSGNSGYLGVRRPFVIIQRPNMCMPSNYQQLNGFPSMITMSLSDCTGFTRVQQVQLTGLQATNPEQAEIMQLLKTGVIL